ncbi:hypothetical protein C4546_00255 [Candidatus Parcubacteria bacterium]|jgi:hypothetical protein|nr:MAG: hypothetical protein C4546_00255 [Candidatus Parcubacteria bacterium]
MRRFLGIIIIILSFVLGLVVLLGWSVRLSILKSEPWKQALVQAKIYDNLLSDLTAQVLENGEFKTENLANLPITTTEITQALNSVVTPAFLQTQAEAILDLTFELLLSRTTLNQASLIIPLQDLKNRAPIVVQEILVEKIRKLPICTEAKLKEFAKYQNLDAGLPPCRPQDLDPQKIVGESLKIEEITKQVPDSIDLIKEIQKAPANSENPNFSQTIAQVQKFARQALQYHVLATLVWVVLLLGLFALFLPSLRRSFRWFSIAVFLPTFGLLVGSFVARDQIGKVVFSQEFSANLAGKSLELVIQNLASQLITQIQIVAGLGLVVSVVAFAIQFVWPPLKKSASKP